MDSVSTVNRVIVILRQALQERDRMACIVDCSREVRNKGLGKGPHASSNDAAANLQGLILSLQDSGVSDARSLMRFMVEGMLAEEFGHETRNDPEFQRMVVEVHQALIDSASIRALFDSLL
ncbi:hypothetical protein [Caballeronia telluris]|uniref:Uncharacterized protein n=1 Tax=Caballeronia telluris TaxID=326475 RepID=A0A158ETZ1_9BURK|nr:hypothetical protein [Caballeronia telluris]SAL10559.1 hypothetical protein AWB66_00207 [Caballeronia telluris]